MTERLIACLATRYGDLCVYDMLAFSSIVDKCVAMGRIERDSEMTFEGFSSKAWADYAKHKSRIATSVCKINGELKARLAALDEKHAPDMVDPLLGADPWADRQGMGSPNQTKHLHVAKRHGLLGDPVHMSMNLWCSNHSVGIGEPFQAMHGRAFTTVLL